MAGSAIGISLLILALLWCVPVSIVLLVMGFIGKRVGDFPTCSSCGFDVSGIATDENSKCPECGSVLHNNMVIGRRQKRPSFVVIGAIPLLFAGAIATLVLYKGGWTQLNANKPVILLSADLAIGGKFESAALSELKTRMSRNELSRSQVSSLVRYALMAQEDIKRPWDPMAGDLLEMARSAGKMSDADWKKYVMNACRVQLEISPRVMRGDPITLGMKQLPSRVARSSTIDCTVVVEGFNVNGVPLRAFESARPQLAFRPSSFGAVESVTYIDSESVEPGTYQIQAALRYKLRNDQIFDGREAVSFSVTILPIGTQAYVLKSDPIYDAVINFETVVEGVKLTQLKNGLARSDFKVRFNNPPVDVAFDVVLKYHDSESVERELLLGWVARRSVAEWNEQMTTAGNAIAADHEVLTRISEEDVFELELRPNLEIAKKQRNMFQIWGTPVTLSTGVEVVFDAPPTK